MARIPFPGTTYPEVNRLGQVTLPDAVTRLDNGDLDVTGLGRIRAGFTRTDRGVFAVGSLSTGMLLVQTTENQPIEPDDDVPMTLTELRDSIRRVLGAVNLAWKLAADIHGWGPITTSATSPARVHCSRPKLRWH
jgi:hypothetical protein